MKYIAKRKPQNSTTYNPSLAVTPFRSNQRAVRYENSPNDTPIEYAT
jgi:hypothetical protein